MKNTNSRPANRTADRKIYAKLAAVTAVAVVVAFTAFMIWGNMTIELHEITVASDRLPEAFSGFRIAHVSDLHNREFGDGNERLLRILADCAPDMIAITGDLVDSNHTDTDAALHFVAEAAQIAPTYYVTGNHEARIDGYAELRDGIASTGATVLEDSSTKITRGENSILILGLNDPDISGRGALADGTSSTTTLMTAEKLRMMADGSVEFTVLLSHRPELFDAYAFVGVDLTLCGHAHGGQFRIPFIGGLYAPGQGFFPKYDAGLYTKGATSMAVSRGLGNSVIPIRFNNRPEIVLIELQTEK